MTNQAIYEFAIAKQSAKGVPASAAAFKTRLMGGDIQPMRDVQDLAETGRNRMLRTSFVAATGGEGNPQIAVRPGIAGLLLWGALGSKSVTPRASTTLAAAALAADTNIKVTAVTDMAVGDVLAIGAGASLVYREISIVGTAGAGGTGITLTAALGQDQANGAAVVEAEVSHTIVPANSLPWFTCWRMLGDQIWEKYIDCKLSQLEQISEAGQVMSMTAAFQARTHQWLSEADYATQAGGVAEEAGAEHYVHHHGSGLLVVDGDVISEMQRVALTINNNAARQPGDSVVTDDISEGRQQITIATRQRVAAKALELYKRLHYGSDSPTSGATPTPNVLELGAGGLDFAWRLQATPERSIRHVTNRVQVKAISGFTPGTGNDPLRAEVTYEAYDVEALAAFQSTVINDVTAY